MEKWNGRSMASMVLLFTLSAVAMLWALTLRWQGELRSAVFNQAEQRSLQMADAMSGQVAAELQLLDHVLLDLREQWSDDPVLFESFVKRKLEALPPEMVAHLTLVNARGRIAYSSLGKGLGLDVSDRPYFKAAQSGEDGVEIGEPVVSRLNGHWLAPIGRPIFRDGRFAGEIHLSVSTEFLARRLVRLTFAQEDVVAMIHPSGKRFLARSQNNPAAMEQTIPPLRPFLQDLAAASGTYRGKGVVDGVSRLYGWYRIPGSGVVVVVGVAEPSVLAPLASSINRSDGLTGFLSVALVLAGLLAAWLLARVERSANAVGHSEQLLKDAQRMAKLGHWTIELGTGVLMWSEEVYRIYGKQRGVDIPTHEMFANMLHLHDRYRVEQSLRKMVKTGEPIDDHMRIVMPDGSLKHLLALSAVDQKNGRTVRAHGTVQDITEVREAQLALEKLNNELETRVAARTCELSALNKELEAFTYSVSHDLRTPLRSIHGFATLLEEESESLSPEGRSHLRRIQDGARRMGLLITDLLTMAHHSRAVVNLERVNLSELAQAVAAELERSEPSRAMQWTIHPGLVVMADPVLMRVVLQNLLGNAWKYTGQTERPQIAFTRVGEAGGLVEFCVRDNGAGFDMAFVDQLFQPFKRLHAQHEFEGTGVGLASVQRLVQRHGGTVRAEGAVGRGAAMYFTVPSAVAGTEAAG